jgi:hypothetical protein
MEQMKTSREISKCSGGWADAAARPGDETTKRHADLMAALYEIAHQLAVANEQHRAVFGSGEALSFLVESRNPPPGTPPLSPL